LISLKHLLLAGCFAFSLSGPAIAKDPYVTAAMVDIARLMPPPPAKGSPAEAADMQAVLDAQAHASDTRKAQALTDSKENIHVVFNSVLGDTFATANLPKTTKLFERIGDSESATLDAAKPVFARQRPWIANPAVKAYATPSKSPSYPSGHTTRVTIDAIVMAKMIPEKQREIWTRANDYAESRVIGGMHYPTDIQAGERSGTVIAAAMFEQPDFKADLEAAKTELRTALGFVEK
jgi:acid phosphatase (class A)